MKAFQTVLLMLLLVLLTACGAPGPIMPGDRAGTERSSTISQSSYRVVRGDTLYSIAFRYGLDWRELARMNSIAAPYTIRVGQNLQLRSQSIASTPSQQRQPVQDTLPGQTGTIGAPPRRVESRTIAGDTTSSTSQPEPDSSTTSDRSEITAPTTEPEPEPRVSAAPPASTTPAPTPAPVQPASRSQTRTNIQTSGNGRSVAGTTWYWPTQGQLARRFNANDTRKGIHIAGESGQSIRSAADGEVVYSGSGLIGYGELIIIKHSDSMLSAYAHNRQRQVEQGDRVQAGQQIALMGEFEPNRPLLHFEIRRNGTPDDPLKYLPSR